jgi:SAM-dependent methyltransferase
MEYARFTSLTKIDMQREHGLQRWLSSPLIYKLFQDAVGGNALRRRLLRDHVKPKKGDRLIDIGCGPAQILPWLPDVEYLGFDVNAAYIARARRKYGNKGTFVVGDTQSLWNDPRFSNADLVIGLGLLHHLNDEEAMHCLQFAHRALKPGGRLVCLDACWVPQQGFLRHFVMSLDRGQHIRTEQGYRSLASAVFRNLKTSVDMKPFRIPYVTVVLECRK